jgi:hypothetical protein
MHRSRPRATCRLLKIKGLRAHTWSNFLSSLYNIFPSREVFAPFQSMHGKISRLVNAPRIETASFTNHKARQARVIESENKPQKKNCECIAHLGLFKKVSEWIGEALL